MFLGSKKNPCYFCAFNFAGFWGPLLAFSLSKSRFFFFNWLFLQLLWYLQVIVSQNFLVNHFFCENCEKNLLANFCSQDRSWTYLNSYEASLILLELINCLTFFKKDASSFQKQQNEDWLAFLSQSKSTCHCLIYCLLKWLAYSCTYWYITIISLIRIFSYNFYCNYLLWKEAKRCISTKKNKE